MRLPPESIWTLEHDDNPDNRAPRNLYTSHPYQTVREAWLWLFPMSAFRSQIHSRAQPPLLTKGDYTSKWYAPQKVLSIGFLRVARQPDRPGSPLGQVREMAVRQPS